jgi:hypothetical protein
VSFAVTCAALIVMAACTAEQVKRAADDVQAAAKAAEPILPPPFGLIAGAVAGIAGVVGSLAAGKAKGNAIAAGTDPHPVATFLSEHNWIYPSITAALMAARSYGLLHMSPEELATLLAGMGSALGVQLYANGKADAKADVAAGVSTQSGT